LQLGIADRCTELAVAYAKERVQFDRPIAAFQAIKHLCADMLVRTEVARAAVYAAGAHLDDVDLASYADLDRGISGAKVMAGEAAIANAKAATQVYGGMGFTWEVDVHLFLKRAWLLDTHFGTGEQHADVVGTALGAGT
jgi:alkylation response protein AidB-like acyl-CoA dehydrogenase